VVLLKPDPERRIGWRGRYEDPDSGRTVKETLDGALTTAELREDWAIKKSKTLALRRLELEGGALAKTGTALDAAIDRYFEDHPDLRDATREGYKATAEKFRAWAKRTGLRSADEVTGPKVAAFRAELVKERRQVHVKGGKRGAVKITTEPRSPHTVNRELRAIGTVLAYLRRLGLLPRLTTDALRDALKKLPTPRKRIEFRKPHELQKLLDAALRHDSNTFAATRAEHAGERPAGTTPRYTPIAPLVAAAMLTGMRAGELIGLDWANVDLEAADAAGRTVGEIQVTEASKTHAARTVYLEVSPALRALLASMHLAAGRPKAGSVFGVTEGEATAAMKRLAGEYGAPAGSGFQALRRTCGTYLTNAPSIFGAASAYRSAKQLGHSVQIAERHYLGVIRLPADARTLEAAMQIDAQVARVTAGVRPGTGRVRVSG
jgi:integrase